MSNLPFVEEILADLRRFKECVEDGQDVDLDRGRFDLLTQLGLLERVQRSPALWVMTQAGEDAITQPAAGEPADGVEGFACWLIDHCEGYEIFEEKIQEWVAGYLKSEAYQRVAAAPAAAHGDEAVRKDAERYRFLKSEVNPSLMERLDCNYPANEWDVHIDAAMRAQAGEGGE